LSGGGDDPCDQTDKTGNQNGEKRELNRKEITLLEKFDDRFTISNRDSKISSDHVGDEMKILDIERPVQSVFFSEGSDEVWICILTRQQHGWIPGNHVEQRKGDERNSEENRKKHEYSF
jgi:hypothetical protein